MNNNITNAERYRLERQQQVEDRRQEIISTARTLFLQQGIEQTTMQEIADAAHISKMTLYRYFPDRPNVALEVAIETLQEVRACVLQYLILDSGQDVLIRSIFTSLVDCYDEMEDAYKYMAMFDNLYSTSYPTPEFQQRYQDELQRIFGASLDGLVTDHTKHALLAQVITIMNMIVSYLQRLALRGSLMSDEQMLPVEMQLRIFREIVTRIVNELSLE